MYKNTIIKSIINSVKNGIILFIEVYLIIRLGVIFNSKGIISTFTNPTFIFLFYMVQFDVFNTERKLNI